MEGFGCNPILDSLETMAAHDPATMKEGACQLDGAVLGNVPGAATLRSKRRDESTREWRGTFVFRSEHGPAVVELVERGREVLLQAMIEGERKKLNVRVEWTSLHAGLALFGSAGEPY